MLLEAQIYQFPAQNMTKNKNETARSCQQLTPVVAATTNVYLFLTTLTTNHSLNLTLHTFVCTICAHICANVS